MKTPEIRHPAEAQILAKVSPSVIDRAAKVRLMAFDVDGVLTDGTLWYSRNGEVVKGFHALDGHGLRLLKESGILVAMITGRQGPIVDRRAAELGIDITRQGVRDKAGLLQELAQEFGLDMEQVGFMGDDLIDLGALQRAGLAASVPNAPAYVTQAAHWVSERPGGQGAARECCDLILAAQGRLAAFFDPQSSMLMTGAIQ